MMKECHTKQVLKIKPDIFKYISYRNYLSDFYKYKKSENSNFSYKVLANMAGFSAASQFLLVMQGKRNVTPKTMPNFSKVLKLNVREHKYFETLVQFEQAENANTKKYFYEKLIPIYKKEHRHLMANQYKYLSNWYGPVIYEMITLKNFKEDPKWIAKKLKNQITPFQAKKMLGLLFELKLVKRDEKGQIRVVESTIVTPDEVYDVAALDFHKQVIGLAQRSLNEGKEDVQKELIAMTTKLSKNKFKKLQEILKDCRNRVMQELENEDEEAQDVYQLNLHLFSLTDIKEGNDANVC